MSFEIKNIKTTSVNENSSSNIDTQYNSISNFTDDYYVEFIISTNGKLYAPSKLHLKAFSMRDIRLLSLQEASYLELLCDILNKNIQENKDSLIVDTKQFALNELIELMFKFYGTFISSNIECNYDYTQDDLDSILDEKLKQDLVSKKWQPKLFFTIKDFSVYDSQDDLEKLKLYYIYKRDNTEIKFHIMKVQDYIDLIKYSNSKKNVDRTLAIRLTTLDKYNLLDFSKLNLINKIDLYNNSVSQIDDFDLDNVLSYLLNIKIGLKQELKVLSPITQKEVAFNMPSFFSIHTILQAYLLEVINKHSNFTIS